MSRETAFISALRRFADHPAARGLLDDAAVLEVEAGCLVLTHDMLVEGVHFLPSDPPGDVAWKLLAVNLSDLAAKGARPLGVLMGYSLTGDDGWDSAFAAGLATALAGFDLPLLGGDTVAMPDGAPRALGLTAIGAAGEKVPGRDGARAGDHLWVTGTIGDAGAGLRILSGTLEGDAGLIERYRNPRPRLEAGRRLAPLVSAMMDVSDGLLIDASRLAHASGIGLIIELDTIPLSAALLDAEGDTVEARLRAATAGDDYELLFTAPAERASELLALSHQLGLPFSRIGAAEAGPGLRLTHRSDAVALPARLGWEHDASPVERPRRAP
ncbi:MAG TPA: thiamine-phosphate kinase [Allosphingosinicella sp.]|nr:thiamine-phosphate kinase [Allosphingosinicella sp.]